MADNLFNVDPYYQQGGDMVRIGGLSYAIDVAKPQGQRTDMQLVKTGAPTEAAREYQVAGWPASRGNRRNRRFGMSANQFWRDRRRFVRAQQSRQSYYVQIRRR